MPQSSGVPTARKDVFLVQQGAVQTLIDHIYDAAGNSERWRTVLEKATTLFEADSAEIGHIDLANRSFSFFISAGQIYTSARIDHYQSMMTEDPRLVAMTRRPFLPIHCRMIITDEDLHASKLYQELLAPNGVEYTLGVNLVEEHKSITFFTAKRGPEQPAFGEAECQTLGQLVPHLRRALRLYRGFANLELQATATLEALDQIPLGVFIVRPDGTFVIGNRMATEIANGGKSLIIVNGKLAASRGETARRLRRALITVMSAPDSEPQALVVDRPDGEPMRILIAPLSGTSAGRTFVRQKGDLAAIYVNDPTRSYETPWERLQHMFGLFPSEAKLIACLVAGDSVPEAGAKLGLTLGSARQYLKNIHAKTGTHSQGELLRVILQSPVWIEASSA